ncbi:hypothetical protein D3H55_04560 [Bacillus salacetis]|uniref:Uncharacterized protein n=1 Tax=Bacillus salacetis TaxID=2315464 RepID=A0A3A1R452_9BACI|nr:hypothetical protein [Bacillus salacetis]RIW37314.1 hypothetical protein D3H55_04560 [Bacillus salacetis]
MGETYTDYVNRVAITIPDNYIDIKTGDSHAVSKLIQEQIEYHAHNHTLVHLVFSALDQYFKPAAAKSGTNTEIMQELEAIKALLQRGYIPGIAAADPARTVPKKPKALDISDLNDILEAFGG